MPIYPITDEAWELYGHTMLEGNKILAANPKYVKVIDIPSRKVLAKYEPEETIYSATFLTKNKGAILRIGEYMNLHFKERRIHDRRRKADINTKI